jgi:hypothetical protein
MGVSQAPDILQEIMEDMFRIFNEVQVYIDDVGVFSKDWDTHRASLSHVQMSSRLMDSQLTLPNANGQFRKLTGLVIG